jgi:hypothetical protein
VAQTQHRPSPTEQAASTAVLVAANSRATAQLRASTLDMLRRLWRSLGTWHKSDVDRFVPLAGTILDSAQQHMGSLTASYLDRYAALSGEHLGQVTPAVGIEDLRGIDRATELERPFVEVWTALKDGKPLRVAVRLGEQRVEDIAATDLQLAKTHTSRAALGADERVVGYRRVLEGASSCGLCVLASTQRYHREDLMPMHPGCDCDVAPIYGTHDPGRLLNAGTVTDLHAAIDDTFGTSASGGRVIKYENGKPINYRDVIVTHEHGEIGPVLGVRGHDFTGPTEVAAS